MPPARKAPAAFLRTRGPHRGAAMSRIQVSGLQFSYPGSSEPVFEGLGFAVDSDWRVGLVGRNGRGKTTLLRLLAGELSGSGLILSGLRFNLFPFPVADCSLPALSCVKEAVAPYAEWERGMSALLRDKSAPSMEEWGRLESLYARHDGYVIDELVAREASKLAVDPASLARPFLSFSPGEQARLLLAALFLRKNRFLLIDEPTNHLDLRGRGTVADYLAGKQGFIVTSHDRDFLDRSVDHILALEKGGARVERGGYSSYRANRRLRDEEEQQKNERLRKDIVRLKASGEEKARWSDRLEKTKIGTGAADRGYIGAKSARMMKRAVTLRNRVEKELKQKEALLKDLEYAPPVSLRPLRHPARVLVRLKEVCAGYGGEPVLIGLCLDVLPGERIALTGRNGAGKTTLLKLITGELLPAGGFVSRPGNLAVSVLPQKPEGLCGTPRDFARLQSLPGDHFLMLLRKLDFPREAFESDMRGFSPGQKKKVLLAASLARPAHLYVWDEPLNYLDIESREQVEDMLGRTAATLVFVEHDRRFIDRVATRTIVLGE